MQWDGQSSRASEVCLSNVVSLLLPADLEDLAMQHFMIGHCLGKRRAMDSVAYFGTMKA